MPRSPDSLDDTTPREADAPDVRRRVGWLLRSTRLHASPPGSTATTFAQRLGVAPAAVSKWEKGSEDPTATELEGYERILDLRPGVLRAVVAGLRREFDQPARRTADPAPRELAVLSERVRAALTGRADGGEWLTFAATLAQDLVTVPDFVARPAIDRLVAETVRGGDSAYLTRMEALALLRTSPYHEVVREACLDFALAEHTQLAADVMGVLGVRPEASLLRSMSDLLTHPNDSVFSGACHAIFTMRHTSPRLRAADLHAVAGVVVDAYAASVEDPVRHAALSATLRQLPRGFRKLVGAAGLAPLATPPLAGDTHSYDAAWTLASSIGDEVMLRRGARPEPLLTRTTYEALTDRWTVRSFWARCALMVLPYRDTIGEVVAERCDAASEEELFRAGGAGPPPGAQPARPGSGVGRGRRPRTAPAGPARDRPRRGRRRPRAGHRAARGGRTGRTSAGDVRRRHDGERGARGVDRRRPARRGGPVGSAVVAPAGEPGGRRRTLRRGRGVLRTQRLDEGSVDPVQGSWARDRLSRS